MLVFHVRHLCVGCRLRKCCDSIAAVVVLATGACRATRCDSAGMASLSAKREKSAAAGDKHRALKKNRRTACTRLASGSNWLAIQTAALAAAKTLRPRRSLLPVGGVAAIGRSCATQYHLAKICSSCCSNSSYSTGWRGSSLYRPRRGSAYVPLAQ